MSHDEILEVVAADRDGKRILEATIGAGLTWRNADIGRDPLYPRFDFTRKLYRIAPEPPKPREWWINAYRLWMSGPHSSAEVANQVAAPNRTRLIHVREVLNESEADSVRAP